MKTLNICFVALVAGVVATNSLRAAVQDAAFLQGSTLADGSAYLNSATPKAIAWTEKSSIDPGAFEHSFVEPAKLMVKEDGDYLVAATMPIISIDDNDNRPCQALEVYVNGEPAPGTVGSSGYIRNQPRNANMQRETSDHAHALLAGLSAGDVIEVRAYKTAQPAIRTQIQSASLYVERVDASRTVFAALSDAATNDADLNPDFEDPGPTQLAWTSTRKDSGITHNNGQPGIRLSAGTYMLFVNVPMQSTVQRASAGLEILLGNEEFPRAGFTAFQGYIRNASGHNKASVHWAGVIQVEDTQTLILQTVRQAQTGNVTIQPNKQASVYLEKIDDGNSVLAVSATGPDNWNPAQKVALAWEEESISDSRLYRRGNGNTQIQIQQAGHYLLLYQDTLFTAPGGGPDRPNPRISIEVNGQEVQGAETKTHYIRDANDHNESSASLVFLLENLAANDTITVSTQREGQTGIVSITDENQEYEGGALLSLIRKESLADPGSIQSAPRLVSATGNINGFQARIQNFSASVDEDSVQATLNGEAVTPEVSTSGGLTTISYNFPEVPASMSVHQVSLSFSDTSQSLHHTEFQFTVPFFQPIPVSSARPVSEAGDPGFLWRVYLVENGTVGNTTLAESALAGDSQWGENLADPQAVYRSTVGNGKVGEANEPIEFEIGTVINLDQAQDGGAGGFPNNDGMPGIPGLREGENVDNTNDFAAEILTWLHLTPGDWEFTVNSDDGFKMTMGGAHPSDKLASNVGEFPGTRGAQDSTFSVTIFEEGLYPVRILMFERGGGANIEFVVTGANGARHLVNAENSPVKSYRSVTGEARPYAVAVAPGLGATGVSPDANVEIVLNDAGDVDASAVSLSLNGDAVNPEVSKSGGTVSITYDPDGFFASESENTIALNWTMGADRSWKFTVAEYTTLTPGIRMNPDTSKRGFLWRAHQNWNAPAVNSVAAAKTRLDGEAIDQATGQPWENLADPQLDEGTLGPADDPNPDWEPIEFEIGDVVNVREADVNRGNFHDGNGHPEPPIPGFTENANGALDDLAVEILYFVDLPAGATTFGVNSDDGFETTVGRFESNDGRLEDLFSPILVVGHDYGTHGTRDTLYHVVAEEAGAYAFRTVWFERGGGSSIELFIVNDDGSRALLNSADSMARTYRSAAAIGGALAREVLPRPNSVAEIDASILVELVDGEWPVNPDSVTLSLNGTTVAADVRRSGDVTTIRYQPAMSFPERTAFGAVLNFTEGGNAATRSWSFTTVDDRLLAYWDFNDAGDETAVVDLVQGAVGDLEGGAIYTDDGGGRTGSAGDRAIDLGGTSEEQLINVEPVEWLKLASAQDRITFSFWQQWNTAITTQSMLWAVSPSSPNGQRGASVHTPWSNNNVYFDTAGCCTGATRTYQDVNVLEQNLLWDEWNHFAFVKKGSTKEIWINGELLIRGNNSAPLPDDFVRLIIGANGDNKEQSHHGLIDDFAIFANALTEAEIAELADGKRPDEIRAIVPIVTESPAISITLNPDGTATITFDGVLHSSDSVTGPFEPVAGASSPYIVETRGTSGPPIPGQPAPQASAERFYIAR